MRVICDIEECDMEGDYSTVIGIEVTCRRCGEVAECYGTSSASVRAALVMLRESCPNEEKNFYVASNGEDSDE